MTIRTVNPATGEPLEDYAEMDGRAIDAALDDSWSGFCEWRHRSFPERAELLLRLAEILRTNRDDYAGLLSTEMGKPITESRAEIEKCAWNCEFYAANGAALLADEPTPSTATSSYVQFAPLGPVLAIMPWNYPFWQVLRAAAPILMAGNSIVLKHASNVTGSALELEQIFRALDAPQGLLRTLVVRGSAVGPVIDDPRIRAVTLTGSEAVGAEVAARAGAALKKAVLELGGSDAFIVLADADLDQAVPTAVRARFQNTGQSCIAAKRFIVEAPIRHEFEERFAAAVSQLRRGDPLDAETQIGPVARDDLRDDLQDQLERSLAGGGRVLCGGEPAAGPGYFYEPTVVTDVRPDLPVFREETFGPLAAIVEAADVADAVRLANDSIYGLSSNIWTRDVEQARALAADIEAGGVFINGMTASDPRLPFGGVKRSGYGRELGRYGIREFVNIQTVWIGPTDGASVETRT